MLMQALYVFKILSLVSEDVRCHIPALPAWGTSRDVQRPGSRPISAGWTRYSHHYNTSRLSAKSLSHWDIPTVGPNIIIFRAAQT